MADTANLVDAAHMADSGRYGGLEDGVDLVDSDVWTRQAWQTWMDVVDKVDMLDGVDAVKRGLEICEGFICYFIVT